MHHRHPSPLAVWAHSDVGRKRAHNEDSHLVDAARGLVAVADGVGGYAAGEVASALALSVIDDVVRAAGVDDDNNSDNDKDDTPDRTALLETAVQQAHARLATASAADHNLLGMATTATVLLFDGPRATLGHVGDSRAYRLRAGVLVQLSRDHTLVAEQLRAGLIDAAGARTSPWKNIITRAVGIGGDLVVDVATLDVVAGDRFLLCSDGLTGLVDDDEIAAGLAGPDLDTLPARLIDVANERGGPDNITVVVVLPQLPAVEASPAVVVADPPRAHEVRSGLWAWLARWVV